MAKAAFIIAGIVSGMSVGAPAAERIPFDRDNFVSCNSPEDRFEIVVCSSPGVIDLLNHYHQSFEYASSNSIAKEGASRAYLQWYNSVRARCAVIESVQRQSSCVSDTVTAEIQQFDSFVNALYAGVSDIEGEEECDGCEEVTSKVQKDDDTLPSSLGDCSITSIAEIGSRLAGVPDSGSAVTYANGGFQVSYDVLPSINRSQVGDQVRLCLAEIPDNCPPGDSRGRVYQATNLRTGEHWEAADSSHVCGGA